MDYDLPKINETLKLTNTFNNINIPKQKIKIDVPNLIEYNEEIDYMSETSIEESDEQNSQGEVHNVNNENDEQNSQREKGEKNNILINEKDNISLLSMNIINNDNTKDMFDLLKNKNIDLNGLIQTNTSLNENIVDNKINYLESLSEDMIRYNNINNTSQFNSGDIQSNIKLNNDNKNYSHNNINNNKLQELFSINSQVGFLISLSKIIESIFPKNLLDGYSERLSSSKIELANALKEVNELLKIPAVVNSPWVKLLIILIMPMIITIGINIFIKRINGQTINASNNNKNIFDDNDMKQDNNVSNIINHFSSKKYLTNESNKSLNSIQLKKKKILIPSKKTIKNTRFG